MPAITAQRSQASVPETGRATAPVSGCRVRINSEDLFQQQLEVEIDHDGRIYRLRRTQLNKLILTA